MSEITSCSIGIKHGDGTVTSIFCEYDGYPLGVGKLLTMHYNSLGQAAILISRGNLSALGKTERGSENLIPGFSGGQDNYAGTYGYVLDTSYSKEYSYLYGEDNTWWVYTADSAGNIIGQTVEQAIDNEMGKLLDEDAQIVASLKTFLEYLLTPCKQEESGAYEAFEPDLIDSFKDVISQYLPFSQVESFRKEVEMAKEAAAKTHSQLK